MYNPNDEKLQYLIKMRKKLFDYPGQEKYLYGQFVKHCATLKTIPEHYLRYCATLRTIEQYLPSNGKVLETGGPSILGEFIGMKLDSYETTNSDLRYKIDKEGPYDVILSLEVIEHLKDVESEKIEDIVLFNRSGADNYLKEIYRVIHPSGMLILTTPNPCSLEALKRLLNYAPPLIFDKHVREYTKKELQSMLKDFEVILYTTVNVFFNLDNDNTGPFISLGASSGDRGDDHVIIASPRL